MPSLSVAANCEGMNIKMKGCFVDIG